MTITVERRDTKWQGDVFVISPQGDDTRTHGRIYVSAKPWLEEGRIEAGQGEGYAYRRVDEEVREKYIHLLPDK